MATLNVSVTARDSTGLTGSGSATIDVTGGQTVPINIGETAIVAGDDSGNGNFLCAQKVTLPNPGTLQSISFYVATAAGQLRLGIYTSAGADPGTLIAQTAAFTPVVGWNTKPLTATLPAGDYWLAYTPSSNSLHFRLTSGGGPVKFGARTFGAMPATYPAGQATNANHWSFYATVLVNQADLPPPPPAGKITKFVGTAANWSNPSIIDGKQWFNHHGGRTWSLTKIDDFTLRMEVRQGDPEAIDVGGERSEISGTDYPPGALIDFEYNITIEAGQPQTNLAWCALTQVHGDNGSGADARVCEVSLLNEKMVVTGNFDSSAQFPSFEWRDPSNIVRGRTYKMRLQIQRGTNGSFKFWRDDVLLLNRAGATQGVNNYIKLGVYRGWPGEVPQTLAVRYANIHIIA